ncbi:uncharacterized protein LOC130671420 [Microplitis mediator]|uniref:uncharacterized protein LOC130671420 n=1 Tax=Microplitis mediator TaxID=375433 RepID=UPI0025563705|nr:uncharacterized protein LOC130671420 [Microplitis mediator]
MCLRLVCFIFFICILNQVNSAPLNSEQLTEKMKSAQEDATIKTILASFVIRKSAKLENITKNKAIAYSEAVESRRNFEIMAEELNRIIEDKEKKLETNRARAEANKTDSGAQDAVIRAQDELKQVKQIEITIDEKIRNLTIAESLAKNDWETAEEKARKMAANAKETKREAVSAVVRAHKITAANFLYLSKDAQNLSPRMIAQKICADYFKNTIDNLMPGLATKHSSSYKTMNKIWLQGQVEFADSFKVKMRKALKHKQFFSL